MKKFLADRWQLGRGEIELPLAPRLAFSVTVSSADVVQLLARRDEELIPIKTGCDWTYRGLLDGFDGLFLAATTDTVFGFTFHGRERQLEEPHDDAPPPEERFILPTDNLLLQMRRKMKSDVSNMRRGPMEPEDDLGAFSYGVDDGDYLFEEEMSEMLAKAQADKEAAAKAAKESVAKGEPGGTPEKPVELPKEPAVGAKSVAPAGDPA